jgi:lipopolysaccharide biosynthesis regulator YciM
VPSRTRSPAASATAALVTWLVTGAVGPALVALPVNLVADKLTDAAARWFKRLRQTDDLSRLVKAATGTSVELSRAEMTALRKLLEQEQAWRLLAAGPLANGLAELTGRIAACLPARDGRTAEDAAAAASVIARGLVEFAVFDLQPEVFQKVVLARLQQLSDQASALDEALFRVHKDLYALVGDAQELFRQVMDRLPPGRADLGEVRIYLTALIDWLNTDPWPQDPRLGGPRLTPGGIERKLRVAAPGPRSGEGVDADELARRCRRLVILGGPGSGKTWLAMRTARTCAQEALTALDDAGLDEVELPLYTTCSRLVGVPGDVREAVVSSTLDWIGDLGGSRIVTALRLLFAERGDEPTLLVIDSLDEAGDTAAARDRLRQVGSLRPPWRVVLTSRPSSWSNQLGLDTTSPDQQVGGLQPLRYPDDVEPVIQRWFADRPGQGAALAAQLARRPGPRQAATVPLILAFYCILGGQQLPDSRRGLYQQVINRMLHAPWRTGSGAPPDLDACRAVLRAWAWAGAAQNHPVSGVGRWEDDIPAPPAELSAADRIAVDHIAAPQGGPDFDTGRTRRRFVHRSLREFLVAEYIAGLPAEQAVRELLPHLWYDPDWEQAAPAAIALHPQHDEVLRGLLREASGSGEIPADLSVIDAAGEARRLLAGVADESREDEWSPELAAIIGQARLGLARPRTAADIGEAARWPVSNRLVCAALLGQLDGGGGDLASVARAVTRLDPTAEDKRQVRQAVLARLAQTDVYVVLDLVGALTQLDPAEDDKRQARQAVLDMLASRPAPLGAEWLARALGQLDPTGEDTARARRVLLEALVRDPGGVSLPRALNALGATGEDKRQAQRTLLDWLAREMASESGARVARVVANALAELELADHDLRQARRTLLELLASNPGFETVDGLIRLGATAEDQRQARAVLLELLPRESHAWQAEQLIGMLAWLSPSALDQREAREILLRLIAHVTSGGHAGRLARALIQLDPTDDDKRQARERLLTLLAGETREHVASQIADSLAQLDPTAQDKRQARRVLLNMLAIDPSAALATSLAALDPVDRDQRQARQALMGLMDNGPRLQVTHALIQLNATAQDKRQAREAALRKLAGATSRLETEGLVGALAELDPADDDKRQARESALRLLADQTYPGDVERLIGLLVVLDPPADDRRRARETLLGLLARRSDGYTARTLMHTLIQLDLTVRDLAAWPAWAAPPTAELLAAVRQNSVLDEWLAALPSFSPIPP